VNKGNVCTFVKGERRAVSNNTDCTELLLSNNNDSAGVMWIQRYFLSRGRRLCLSCPSVVGVSLQWLCHPIGHRYFVDSSWSSQRGNPTFTCCVN